MHILMDNIDFHAVSITEPIHNTKNNTYTSNILYYGEDINKFIDLFINNPIVLSSSNTESSIEINNNIMYDFLYKLDNTLLEYLILNSQKIFNGIVDEKSVNNMLMRSIHVPQKYNESPYIIINTDNKNIDNLSTLNFKINCIVFYRNKFNIKFDLKLENENETENEMNNVDNKNITNITNRDGIINDVNDVNECIEFALNLSSDFDDDDASIILTEMV